MTMRAKTYAILQRAVEEGFKRGWSRAHKYAESPTDDYIEDQVVSAIMGDICEVFNFDEGNDT